MKLDTTTVATVSGLIVILCGTMFILNTTLRRNDRVGRIWGIAFVGGILETLAYTIAGLEPTAWWTIAVGNGGVVLTFGMLWSGFRVANARRALYAIPLVAGAAVGLAALLRGPHGGIWAGAFEMFVAVTIFAALGCVETLRGWLRRSVNARIIGVALFILTVYYALRAAVILIVGPDSHLFAAAFSPIVATLLDLSLIVIGTTTISMLQTERFRRPGRVDPSESQAEGLLGAEQFRVLAEVWLRRAVRDRSTLALVLVELANVEEINLAFGRALGDNAIRLMGRLTVGDAPTAALVGLLSRRRFAVLFPMEDEDDARMVADRINSDALNSPIDASDRFRAAAFIGITSTRAAGSRYDDLLETAEAVLGLAVESGRPGTVEYAA